MYFYCMTISAVPNAIKEHLSKDVQMAKLVVGVTPYALEVHNNICLRLCKSITSQQLSTKVAAVIYSRFLGLFGGQEPTAADITQMPYEQLRSIGLSHAKATYVHNVAQYFLEHGLTDAHLMAMDDDAVREALLPIKGVGRWTVEMLLMFALGREDVFAPDDLGIQQAMIQLYGLDGTNKKLLVRQMHERAALWAPYRTWACFYLWRYKDAGVGGDI